MVLTLQYALPAYTASWPNKATVSQQLIDNGVVGASARGAWAFLFGKPTEASSSVQYVAPVIRSTEGRLLREDCVTPCTVNITYRSEILRGDGRMKIRYQTAGWVEYPATGDVKAPENATSGETEFVSLEEGHPAIRVKVFEKVPVLGGR